MAVTADIEQAEQIAWPPFQETDLVYEVPEMSLEYHARIRAAALIQSVLSDHAPIAEVCEIEKPIESLHEAIERAAEGDEHGWNMVRVNAKTDVVERTLKTGHVADPVPLVITDNGTIMQHKQSLESVQANSLRYASGNRIMRERTEAETRNTYRTEQLYRQGWFEDYSMLVISRAEDLPEAGFFTETMSCALQLTGKSKDGLAIESAFVSGVRDQAEAQNDLRGGSAGVQHDEQTVVALGERLQVDLLGKTPAEIIDTPILIHNSLIPNGVIDVVKMYDDCAGGTFFGENRPRENYTDYRHKCHAREQSFQPKVDKITQELVAEAPLIQSPVQATQRLHKISEKHMVEHAVKDSSIDVRVFGSEAAQHIEMARHYMSMGNIDLAETRLSKAKQTAVSSSCPSGMTGGSLQSGDKLASDSSAGSDKYGSLTFKCPKGHSNIRPRNKLLSHCQKCGVSVKC